MVHHFVPSVNPRISAGWSITRFKAAYLVAFSRYFGRVGTFCWAPGKTAKIPSIFSSFCPALLTGTGPWNTIKTRNTKGRGAVPPALSSTGEI